MSLTPERTAELQELCRQYRIDVLTAIHGAHLFFYQEEKQADYQLHFDCSYSFLHELRYSDHL